MGKRRFDTRARYVRHRRARKKISGTESRPRLCVFRSNRQIYAQVVDDTNGHTLVAASSLESDVDLGKDGGKIGTATAVGKVVAERAIVAGVKQVVFDRGGYKFHGRVRALADAARKGGLKF